MSNLNSSLMRQALVRASALLLIAGSLLTACGKHTDNGVVEAAPAPIVAPPVVVTVPVPVPVPVPVAANYIALPAEFRFVNNGYPSYSGSNYFFGFRGYDNLPAKIVLYPNQAAPTPTYNNSRPLDRCTYAVRSNITPLAEADALLHMDSTAPAYPSNWNWNPRGSTVVATISSWRDMNGTALGQVPSASYDLCAFYDANHDGVINQLDVGTNWYQFPFVNNTTWSTGGFNFYFYGGNGGYGFAPIVPPGFH